MSSDATWGDGFFDDFSFAADIPESERDRNIRENARLGYGEMGTGGNAVTPSAFTPQLSQQPPPFITVKHALSEMKELAKQPIITTPFPALNDALGFGGFVSGQTYSVIGGTGLGKTSLQNGVALHVANNGTDVVIAFFEAFAGYNIARMAAPLVGVSSNEIIRGVEKYEADIVTKIPDRIHLLNRPSLNAIGYATHWLADKTGRAPVLIVDYVQKLAEAIQAQQRRPDARLAMSEASSALLELADITKATVIGIQSMSRMNNRRARDVRKLAPHELVDVAKESGAVEYDAAGVIVLTLTDDYEGDERIGTMTVAKSRFGTTCHVDMRFDGKSGLWLDKGRVERDAEEDLKELIRDSLGGKGAVASANDMAKRLRKNRKAVLAAFKEMVKDGEIEMDGNTFGLAS
jgi:KaiC/GvpD/RAD55 family RecA-like ATPase